MMNQKVLALALAGTLSLSLLAGCSGGQSAATPAPDPTPAVTATPAPAPDPTGTPAPAATPAPTDTPAPESTPAGGTQAPVQTPAATPKPTPTPEAQPTPTPEAPGEPVGDPTLVQSMWAEISQKELPSLMDLDDDTLAAVYGIDSGDLKEYLCKIPFMNVQATEFFIARAAEGKLDTVKAAVEARQAALEEQWSSYLPDQLELVKNYKLVTQGDYILFVISEYADEAVDIFNSYFD